MKTSKNIRAVFASAVMITCAFGSFPASNKSIDNPTSPSSPSETRNDTSDPRKDRADQSFGTLRETQSSLDPDAKREFEQQTLTYTEARGKWLEDQQAIPKIEAELKVARSQSEEMEKSPPAQPTYEEREWLSVDGKHKTIATIVESDFRTAKLKKSDGTIVSVEKSKLSDEGKSLIEKMFVDREVYSKQVSQWQRDKDEVTQKIESMEKKLLDAQRPEPTAPDMRMVAEQVASRKRSEKLEEAQKLALERREEELRKAAAKEAERRMEEEEQRKYKERFFDKNGLSLDVKSIQAERDFLGITIRGVVYNRKQRKLAYAQITFNLYDKSGAQIGTALANINGLEPDGAWKFTAIGLADDIDKYKIGDMSGF